MQNEPAVEIEPAVLIEPAVEIEPAFNRGIPQIPLQIYGKVFINVTFFNIIPRAAQYPRCGK